MEAPKIKPLSVSECVDLIRTTLQSVVGDLTVYGEVSEFQHRSGGSLVFFSLKDESSYLRCFMLERELKEEIEDGMEIRVTGYPSLFKKNAGFHIRVKKIEPVGEGALRKQLELTKKKLEGEGLFAPERKRALPKFPESIGIITSEDAAAFTDVGRVLANRWPHATLSLVPSQVQGKPAIKQLIHALRIMQEEVRPDVIILTRGGGSLEDLQAFNSEELAREIYASTIPVVVGVGHERDWSIADFVADVRAATPSNAAELATPHVDDITMQIDALKDSMQYVMRQRLDARTHTLFRLVSTLSGSMRQTIEQFHVLVSRVEQYGARLLEKIQEKNSGISQTEGRLLQGMRTGYARSKERYRALQSLLRSFSPQAVLKRGYSITRVKGKLVRSVHDVKEHDILTTTLSDGEISSDVT